MLASVRRDFTAANDNAATNRSILACSPDNDRNPALGLAIAATTVAGTLLLTAPFILQYIRSPLPFMATPKDKVRKALEFVALQKTKHEDGSWNKMRHFVDLGSGDGEGVYQALQQTHPFIYKATGIELNSTLWLVSQLRRNLLWGLKKRSRSSFYCRDMFGYDLASNRADTVMIFGVNPLMKSISQKLARECRPGTHVLAYRFLIPLDESFDDPKKNGNLNKPEDNNEKRDDNDDLLAAKLVYDVEEMRVYECSNHKYS